MWGELGQAGTERPAGRMNHFTVYDPVKDRLLVLGGFDPYKPGGGCCTNPYQVFKDVWQLDLASDSWSQIGKLEQPLLAFTPIEVAFDGPRNRLVVVGAVFSESSGPAHNVAIDLASWKTTSLPAGPWPSAEWPLRVAFDAARGRIVVHAAYSINKLEGVWIFDVASSTWASVATKTQPEFRFHAPLIAAGAGRAFLFSGYDGETAPSDLWQLDVEGKSWSSVPMSQPPRGRWSHRGVFDPARGSLVGFGGERHGSKDQLETLLIDTSDFSLSEPTLSPAPSRRREHSMVLDTKRRRAIVYGGAFESKHVYDDVWALQLP